MYGCNLKKKKKVEEEQKEKKKNTCFQNFNL